MKTLWAVIPVCGTLMFGSGVISAKPTPRPVRIYSRLLDGKQMMQHPSAGSRLWTAMAGGAITPNDELRALGTSLWMFDADYLSSFRTEDGQVNSQALRDTIRRAKMVGCFPVLGTNFAILPEGTMMPAGYTPVSLADGSVTVQAISPWCPALSTFMSERWANLASDCAPEKPGLMIGVYGENGQAGSFMGTKEMPVLEDGKTVSKKLPVGYWWGDASAMSNFQKSMLRQYETIDKLNTAWGTGYTSEAQIALPVGPESGERYWLDALAWYANGFSYMADVQARIAKRVMPDSPRFLPAGMNGFNPRFGADISSLAKVAARNECTLILEPDRYSVDGRILNVLGATAARFYKANWMMGRRSSEDINPSVRMFDTISGGGVGWVESQALAAGTVPDIERNLRSLDIGKPVVDTALLLPTAQMRLMSGRGLANLSKRYDQLRDRFPLDVVDERLITDGALAGYRTLFIFNTSMLEPGTIKQIGEWLKTGGILVTDIDQAIRIPGGTTSLWNTSVGLMKPTSIDPSFLPQMVGNAYRFELSSDEGRYLKWGDWQPSQLPDSSGWMGFTKKGGLKLPVRGQNSYGLSITARGEKGSRTTVVLDNKPIGVLDADGTVVYKFAINPKPVAGISQLQFVSSGRSSHDIKTVGVQLVGASDFNGAPGVWRFNKPTATIAKSVFTTVGQGGMALLPTITSTHGQDYIRALCQEFVCNRTNLIKHAVDAPLIDGLEDRVESTLLTDRLVMLNRNNKELTRTIALSGLKKVGLVDDEIGGDIKLPVNGINSITIQPRPVELMLGCEQFVNLYTNKAEMLQGCLPDGVPNCVALKDTAKIATRFPLGAAGEYRLFIRALRNGEPSPVDIRIDGKPLAGGAPVRTGDVWYLGSVKLSRGNHILELTGKKYQTVYADFIILSGDSRVEGFRLVQR
ncbi:MAG: hypothetical protein ACYC1M_12450 [Armatimonadota bacterium]